MAERFSALLGFALFVLALLTSLFNAAKFREVSRARSPQEARLPPVPRIRALEARPSPRGPMVYLPPGVRARTGRRSLVPGVRASRLDELDFERLRLLFFRRQWGRRWRTRKPPLDGRRWRLRRRGGDGLLGGRDRNRRLGRLGPLGELRRRKQRRRGRRKLRRRQRRWLVKIPGIDLASAV
jgi:hypothetical protein